MNLHPNNRNFQWRSPEPPFESLTDAQIDSFDRDGGFRYENAFNTAEIAAVVSAIDAFEAEAQAFLKTQKDGARGISRADEIVFNPHLVARSDTLEQFSRHLVFANLCRDLIGADVRLYWDQLVYKKPNTAAEFPWHQDNGYTFVEPQQYLTCWVALTDATVDNGCPWIVPGLHRHGTLRHELTKLGFQCFADHPDAVPLELTAGSIAVFSSLAPHRTGPNTTDAVRKSYILQYAPDGATMLRPDAPPLSCDAPDRQFHILRNGVSV